MLLRDGAVYASYVDALERLLREDLAPAVVARVAETQARQIERALADDETAEGLEELIAANPEARTRRGALEDIEGSLGFYAWSLEQRRRELLRRVAAYRDEEEANQNIRTEPDGGGRSARTSEPMSALVASGELELRASLRVRVDADASAEARRAKRRRAQSRETHAPHRRPPRPRRFRRPALRPRRRVRGETVRCRARGVSRGVLARRVSGGRRGDRESDDGRTAAREVGERPPRKSVKQTPPSSRRADSRRKRFASRCVSRSASGNERSSFASSARVRT